MHRAVRLLDLQEQRIVVVAAGDVMLDRGGTVKVMDFGIARAGDSGMTEAGSILGTAQYLAPEQARGLGKAVTPAADVFALGATLYALLTGKPPFVGSGMVDTIQKIRTAEPAKPSMASSSPP